MKKLAKELELGHEYPPPDEGLFTQKLLEVRMGQMNKNPSGTTLRASHAKHHGCVKAEFLIEPDLPEELRVGVFKQARSYPALIRFSNATSKLQEDGKFQPDIKRDLRGMAIKLMGVEGDKLLEDEKHEKTQDFLLVSHSVIPTKDVEVFFEINGERKLLKALWFFFNPFNLHLREFRILLAQAQKYANPLQIRYSSVVPYLFGSRAVKYAAKPCSNGTSPIPKNPGDNFLREAMNQQLEAGEASFDFMIQFQTDPYKMPIEDASIEWDESISPLQKVATIKISPQTFDTPVQSEFCEHLSFTPWHSLPEHRPLGGISRARREVYLKLQEIRRQKNKVEHKEPTGDEIV